MCVWPLEPLALFHPGLSLVAWQRRASGWVLPRSLGNLEATWLPEQGETWFPVRVDVSLTCKQRDHPEVSHESGPAYSSGCQTL